jgi:hypothetical protein
MLNVQATFLRLGSSMIDTMEREWLVWHALVPDTGMIIQNEQMLCSRRSACIWVAPVDTISKSKIFDDAGLSN